MIGTLFHRAGKLRQRHHAQIGKSNLIIDDTPGISISELRSKCRKYKLEHNLEMVIIDYLQLIPMEGLAATRIRSEGCSPAVL